MDGRTAIIVVASSWLMVVHSTTVAPVFPTTWKASPESNMSQAGFFAGLVETDFYADCDDPAKQRMKTVYPDQYTVITRCDLGVQYILEPSSRGSTCDVWPIMGDECSTCGCPFCVRDTGGHWDALGDTSMILWNEGNMTETSAITGEDVRVWRGVYVTQEGRSDAVDISMSVLDADPSHLVSVDMQSALWISSTTYFRNFDTDVVDADFEPAVGLCADPATLGSMKSETHPRVRGDAASPDKTREDPPVLPEIFYATVVTNISQPGYNGGNVYTNFTADCTEGPALQKSKTTFGNFHSVLVRCDLGLVYQWDLEGINLIGPLVIGVDVPARVCHTCGLPFSVRDTTGAYTTTFDADSSTFIWTEISIDEDTPAVFDGIEVATGTSNNTVTMKVRTDSAGLPTSIDVSEHGWIRTRVELQGLTTEVDTSAFEPPDGPW